MQAPPPAPVVPDDVLDVLDGAPVPEVDVEPVEGAPPLAVVAPSSLQPSARKTEAAEVVTIVSAVRIERQSMRRHNTRKPASRLGSSSRDALSGLRRAPRPGPLDFSRPGTDTRDVSARLPALLASSVFVVACLTPTEITVTVTSRDLGCASGDLVFGDLQILARSQQKDLVDGGSDATSDACKPGASNVALGSIVLTPRDSNRRAELLVVAGVKLPHASPPTSDTAEKCLTEYRSFLAAGAPAGYCKDPAHACGACIVARRGLGFVDHEKLELEVELTAQCQGVFCQAGQTCGKAGACVSAEADCQKGQCDLPGGAGGAGGGGGGGSCIPPTDGGALAFAPIDPSVAGLIDMAADGRGKAWVLLTGEIRSCDSTSCRTEHVPPKSLDSMTQISADGTTIAAARSDGIIHQTAGAPWALFTPPAACGFGTGGPTDVATADGKVHFAGLSTPGAIVGTVDDATCSPVLTWSTVTSSPLTYALPGGAFWIATGDTLARRITSKQTAGAGPIGTPTRLWGYLGPGTHETVFACGPTGLYRATYDPGFTPFADQISTTSCLSVSGVDRCDGTADVWIIGADGSIEGYHVGAAIDPRPPTVTSPSATAVKPVAIAVDRASIWLGTAADVQRSPLPLLP